MQLANALTQGSAQIEWGMHFCDREEHAVPV